MKKAFTMIELLVVMVVGAILSAVAISKIHTGELIDAARSVANDIRYTRILAMDEDAYGISNYHDRYYRFTIASNKTYKITTKRINSGNLVKEDYAVDFLNADKRLCDFEVKECSEKTRVLKAYNVTFKPEVTPTPEWDGLTPTNTIIFNELGEPLNYNNKESGFNIEISKGSDVACIYVEKYSGFVSIEKAACK